MRSILHLKGELTADFYCVVNVTCLIVGFIFGRRQVIDYAGYIVLYPDENSLPFNLDADAHELQSRYELLFRVVENGKE